VIEMAALSPKELCSLAQAMGGKTRLWRMIFDVVVGDGVLPGDGSDALAGVAQRFTFVHESEFAAAPPLEMIVQDVIPDADLVVVYGEPGSGKSFWTLDLVQSINRGSRGARKRVVQGRVAYIAAEGAGGFRNRVKAYKLDNKLDSTDLYVLADAPSFLEAAHVKDVIKRLREIGPVKIVVIDTLAQVAPGGAENSAKTWARSSCTAG
jgi:RecA-family ATPase